MGTAQAVTLLSEDFEGTVNVFAAPTYNYSLNYTFPNTFPPAGGGLNYMMGAAGISGSVSTNFFTATGSPLNLLTGGITGGQIDGGLVTYNLYAQFSTYRLQNDNGTLSVQFLDAGSSPLGAALQIGGAAFVTALGSGNNGTYADARDWGADALAGIVPSGARFAAVQIIEVKTASGKAIDGYVDNVNISISAVPEPGSVALLALGGGLAALARRRR
jgi:hypothetical protein